MRKLIVFILFCVASNTGISQQYEDKSFYLIDSLELQGLTTPDSLEIIKRLRVFHQASDPIKRLEFLAELSSDIEKTDIQIRYAQLALKRIHAYESKKKAQLTGNQLLSLKEAECQALNNLSLAHTHLGNHTESLTLLFKAKRISEKVESKKMLIITLINIGAIFYDQHNLEESLDYHKRAAQLNLEIGDTLSSLYVLNNMGAIYNDMQAFDEAKIVLDSCIKLSEHYDEQRLLGMALNNLGGIYCKQSETLNKGIGLLERSLAIFETLQFEQWLAFTYSKLGKVYLDHEMYEKAHENGLKAHFYAEKLGFKDLVRRSSLILKETYAQKGDYKNAFLYSEQYAIIDNELRGEENRIESLRLENKLNLEKQKEIDNKELALAKAEKRQQQLINYMLLIGSITLLIFASFVVYRLRVSNRRKRKIEQQNNERKLLLKEIHHRVKNNFQIVSSLLRLQAAEENNEYIQHAFDDAVSRIQSMASVHELIYKNEMFAELSTKEYMDKLVNTMRSYSVHENVRISVTTEIERLNIKTLIPLGITINELVTNSLKYAFQKTSIDPQIEISLVKTSDNIFILKYRDNGIGFDQSKRTSNFGMELIYTVISQIEGVVLSKNSSQWKHQIEIQFKQVT